jgi:membrane protease YdiL (CAAX protease family)
LHINNNYSISVWSTRITIPILIIYLLIILPGKNIFFHTNLLVSNHIDTIYYFVIIAFAIYKLKLKVLGFSTKYFKKNLITGFLSGGGVLLSLLIINFSIDLLGMASNAMFAEPPNVKNIILVNSIKEYSVIILIVPLIEQIFFTGIIFQSIAKIISPILAIYSSGVIYSLAKYKLNLGAFFLGALTSFLFKQTKTLYAPIIFHACCAAGGIVIKNFYPRLKTLLGFLF